MTRDEIVAIIKQRLGNYNDSTIDAHIVTEMKLNQIVMEQEASLPWFLVGSTTADQAADATNTEALTLARSGTDCAFLAEYEESTLALYITADGAATALYMRKDQNADLWNAQVSGNINAALQGAAYVYGNAKGAGVNGIFSVYPTPSEAYTIVSLDYYADVSLDTDITNLWLTYAPDLVIAKVGLIIAQFYTALEKFIPGFEKEIGRADRRLAKINALKTEENIRRLMGDS